MNQALSFILRELFIYTVGEVDTMPENGRFGKEIDILIGFMLFFRSKRMFAFMMEVQNSYYFKMIYDACYFKMMVKHRLVAL